MRETKKSSSMLTFRSTLAQSCAMVVPNILYLSYGLCIGFTMVMIPELHKKDAEIVVNEEELTWLSSVNYLAIFFGSSAIGPLTDRLGRQAILKFLAIPAIAGWSVFRWWANDFWTLILGFILLATSCSGAITVSPSYAAEISELRLRGIITATTPTALILGIFLSVLFGSYMHWRTLALTCAAFPLAALCWGLMMPESPLWLMSKGRLAEAERALRWLRGWTSAEVVKTEYELLRQTKSAKASSSSRSRKSYRELYLRREVMMPAFVLLVGFFLCGCNGGLCLQVYAILIFQMFDSPLNEYLATLILVSLQLIASVLLMLFIRQTGRRMPTLVSLAASGLTLLGIAVYSFLLNRGDIPQASGYSWIPTTLVLLTLFASGLGIKNTPWYIAGEVFPMEVRGIAVGVTSAIYYIFATLATKVFLKMLATFTVPGTFLVFAVFNFVGFFVLYWTMPETEGKTLAEIEMFFSKKGKKVQTEDAAYSNKALDPS